MGKANRYFLASLKWVAAIGNKLGDAQIVKMCLAQ